MRVFQYCSARELRQKSGTDFAPLKRVRKRAPIWQVARISFVFGTGVGRRDHRPCVRLRFPGAATGWRDRLGQVPRSGAASRSGPGPGACILERAHRQLERPARIAGRSRVGWTSRTTHDAGTHERRNRGRPRFRRSTPQVIRRTQAGRTVCPSCDSCLLG